ncbi:ABC transporter ATP-binding protein, partial [Candidatus Peregrinibacteria bacterium]|nr:ABC transporter ATP-binding protein [Candidatus Peregrinibacteria bacterium]
NKSLLSLKGQDKGRLLTKISFHFSLLQMGLTNCVFSIFSWTFLSIGLVFSSFFLDTTLLMIVLVSIPASAFLGFIGYIVSKYYISQDQTLYSRILMYINETLEEFPIVKTRNKERQALVHFDKLVKLDSYFRVRRDLWLKYGGKIIFMMIALFGGAVYLFEIYYPFLKVETSAQYVVYGIFFGLVIKLFYMALRIGLFSFPVKLGAAICVPDEKVRSVKSKPKDLNITNISFGSQKIRLGRGMDYVKNLRLEFEKGGRYLVSGSEGHGKTTVGHAIAGLAAINQARPWVIRLNGRRFLYSKWPEYANNVVFVGNEYKSERTLLESLSNEDTKTVKEGDFKKVISVINSNKHFAFLLDNGRAVGRSINGNTYSGVEKALLEMAYCMISRPKIVVIDNVWLDIDDSRINDTLKLLDKSLEKSIIVCLSTRKNKILEYDKEYSI